MEREVLQVSLWDDFLPYEKCRPGKFEDIIHSSNLEGCEGSLVELFKMMAQQLNLRLNITADNGSVCLAASCEGENITGLVSSSFAGMLNGSVDIALSVYSITKHRSEYVDFIPLTMTDTRFLTCAPKPAYSQVNIQTTLMLDLLVPFHEQIYLTAFTPRAVAFWWITMASLVFLINCSSKWLGGDRSLIFPALAVILNQSVPSRVVTGLRRSTSLFFGLLWFTQFVLFNFFTSEYFNLLTVPPLQKAKLDTFRDLANNNVTLHVPDGGMVYLNEFFVPSSEFEVYAQISHNPDTFTNLKYDKRLKEEMLNCKSAVLSEVARLEMAVAVRILR